jgi:hypothetical protein
VLIDLTTAHVLQTPLPGYNELVLWQDNTNVLVASDDAIHLVDVETNTARTATAALSIGDIAGPPAGDRWLELPPTAAYDRKTARPVIREWSLDETQPRWELPVRGLDLGPYGILDWQGPAVRRGNLVVRAGWGYTPTLSGMEIVAVVNARTGLVQRLLPLGEDRIIACCRPPCMGGRPTPCCSTRTVRASSPGMSAPARSPS